jgi:RimJ/RimL family protein N-acetyltransferase
MTPEFDYTPNLIGTGIVLRPLQASDFQSLYLAASDPLVWEQHPDSLRYTEAVFRKNYFDGAMASSGALAILDLPNREIIGSSRFYEWQPDKKEVAIGYTFLIRRHWGGATNAELKQLMLAHAFRRADRVWFHIGENNIRSRKAVEKIGGTYSHTEEKVLNGRPAVTAFYFVDRPAASQIQHAEDDTQ